MSTLLCRCSQWSVRREQYSARSWCRTGLLGVCRRLRFNSTRSLRRPQEELRRQVHPIRYVGAPKDNLVQQIVGLLKICVRLL